GGTGGQGTVTAGTAGQPNTGGGGGGGSSGAGNGGAGGSGIVVIRYVNNGSITVNPGTPPTYTRGIYNIHVYPSNAPFVVDSLSTTSSCPSDPRCSVVATDTYRSSFSVGVPT